MRTRRWWPVLVLVLVRWTQEECDELARWDLLGIKQGLVGTPAVVATIPNTAVTCTTDPATIYTATVPSALKRGKWVLTLRGVVTGTEAETADSAPVSVQLPLRAPAIVTVTRP